MTYALMATPILVVLCLTSLWILRGRGLNGVWASLAVLIALTLVFDNVIVGLGIVGYDDDLILGVRVPYAPIEDFSYAIAAALLMPALWTLLRPKGGE